jgi:hypothetical protein
MPFIAREREFAEPPKISETFTPVAETEITPTAETKPRRIPYSTIPAPRRRLPVIL